VDVGYSKLIFIPLFVSWPQFAYRFSFLLLSASPFSDAVGISFRPESAYLKEIFTPLTERRAVSLPKAGDDPYPMLWYCRIMACRCEALRSEAKQSEAIPSGCRCEALRSEAQQSEAIPVGLASTIIPTFSNRAFLITIQTVSFPFLCALWFSAVQFNIICF